MPFNDLIACSNASYKFCGLNDSASYAPFVARHANRSTNSVGSNGFCSSSVRKLVILKRALSFA